jgi:hypothetical protein
VSIDQVNPAHPVVRRPAFEAVRELSDPRPPEWDLAPIIRSLQSWWL